MLSAVKTIFFIGIKGVAMANLARIFSQMGKSVSGSDVAEEFITDLCLSECGVKVIESFSAEALPADTDLVVYSASHGGHTNAQIVEAKKRGIPVLHQAELIAELLEEFKTPIAVAGCHGKTTTSGMLAYTLQKLGASSSHLVGVSQFNDIFGGEYKGRDYFVFEADEYGIDPPENKTPKFELTDPDYAIITNIDFDHPDIYDSFDSTVIAFDRFMSKIALKSQDSSHLIINGDDLALSNLADEFHANNCLLYGSNTDCDIRYSEIQYEEMKTSFVLNSEEFGVHDVAIEISLFGEMNVANATAVITMCLRLGFPIDGIREAIRGYTGAKRRFEFKFFEKDIYLFDDYAHHPAEIEATIKAAQTRFPNRRTVVIFQPHTYSRTAQFTEEFVESLSLADQVLLLPIFASAREKGSKDSITSEKLVQVAQEKSINNMLSFRSEAELLQNLSKNLDSGDLILTMGAGNVYKMESEIRKLIEN